MHPTLRREIGLGGAIVTGLGSILGTGAFVAIGLAAGMWGDNVLLAIPVAGILATFNGLSSAFLAGRFPVAGGTYEYAYRTVGQWWGFTAGWLFLLAKTASAAAATLGVATYLGFTGETRIVAVSAVAVITALVLAGLRPSTVVNTVLVSITVLALVTFAVSGISDGELRPIAPDAIGVGLLPALGFVFVAYTGYGRIATLGEEVRSPERSIPRAVVVTLAIAAGLYLLVALGGRAAGGAEWGLVLDEGGGLSQLIEPPASQVVAVGAVTAMLGVLLNLILGLSRVWLAMGRRGDMPQRLAKLDRRQNPAAAVICAAVPVVAVSLLGDLSITWSFSAFTVLLYYGITNLAALAIDVRRWTAWAGLVSCVALSFFVPIAVWLTGAGLVAIGLIWKSLRRD